MEPLQRLNAEYKKEIDNLRSIEESINAQFAEAERVARSKNDQVLLVEIQKAKTEALAQVEAARGDAEEKRASQLSKIYQKNIKTRLKGLANIGKAFSSTISKQLQAQKTVNAVTEQANNDQLTAIDKINLAEQERLNTLRQIGEQQKINTSEAEAAVKARAERERRAVRERETAGAISVAETIVRASFAPSALLGGIGTALGTLAGATSSIITELARN